jgi:outer membrane protein insertion porin family
MGISVGVLRRLGIAAVFAFLAILGPAAVAIETAGSAFAQTPPPGVRIDVEGNRRVEAETIRSYFNLNANERLDAAKIDSALKGLYATGLFQDVHITPFPGRILVTVVENPVINRVAFEGNHKAKDEQLSSEVQSKPRGTLSRATVQSDVQRIIEVYQHSGRYDVTVQPKIIELPNGRVDLIFEIDEGGKTGVAKIIFVGNVRFGDYRLRDVIKTGETNWLSFLKSNDLYDSDRIEADRDLLRRFYLKNGFADVRIVSAVGEYDPQLRGFVITFTIDEGVQYRFGTVNIQSNIPAIPSESLRARIRVESGKVYNADAIEKSVEDTTIDVARRGYPFSVVRPRGDRDFETRTVNVTFVVDEGPHTYIERINIKGNTRTRDYVIRREFDIVEGDPYNRALVDRAERRIKGLGYFKSVKITTEPGSAPDRIILNCEVEEQSTGEFSFAGGYSTADGILGEISVGERNLMGRGEQAKISLQYGQYARGFNIGFVEPYFLDNRLALGTDVFFKQTTATTYLGYLSETVGGDIKLGIPLAENISAQTRYTAYTQRISVPSQYEECNNINPNFINSFPTPDKFQQFAAQWVAAGSPVQQNCLQSGEASPAIIQEANQGPVFVSAIGYTLAYNTLDNNRNPTNGLLAEFRQDVAGAGGDVRNIKSTVDTRLYNEVFPGIVSLVRLQGGFATGWGGDDLRMVDHFMGGPNLVRGFQPAGFGPRDITELPYGYNYNNALGGSLYWAATMEYQVPMPMAPKDFGMRLAFFSDAGWLGRYVGPTQFPLTGQSIDVGGSGVIRSSVGVGLIWDSPFGPLRFDFAYTLTRNDFDKLQFFKFGGGGSF